MPYFFKLFVFLLFCVLLSGCIGESNSKMIGNFGNYTSPDGKFSVHVTRREKSLVDFSVMRVGSTKKIVSDYVGSDAMRWFLYWDASGQLWGYGSDIGYFRAFQFCDDDTVKILEVTPEIPLPPDVYSNIPSCLQKKYQLLTGKDTKDLNTDGKLRR